MSLGMATLRDGSVVPKAALINTTMNLSKVKEINFAAICDLVQKCRDPNYTFVTNQGGNSFTILKKWGLIEGDEGNERIHEYVKSVVLNSFEGNGLEIQLVNR